MYIDNNETLLNISKLTLKDKQSYFLESMVDFSKRAIDIIDKKIKDKNPSKLEFNYIDLIAESFFSIRSFCLLMKDGLVSAASAILRIIIEQASIVYLVSKSENNKSSFFRIKEEKNKFYLSTNDEQNAFKKDIKNRYKIRNIKQYFDYGWCCIDGQPVTSLENICNLAGLGSAYPLVEDVINAFSHGQLSIYKMKRNGQDLDIKYINRIYAIVGDSFFKIVDSLCKDFSNGIFSDRDTAILDRAYAFYANYSSYFYQIDSIEGIKLNLNYEETVPLVNSLDALIDKFISSKDIREKYLLSQAYIRNVKETICSFIIFGLNHIKVKKLSFDKIGHLFDEYVVNTLQSYNDKSKINLNDLVSYIDSRGENWIISEEDSEYITSIKLLAETFLEIKREEKKISGKNNEEVS